METQNNNRKLMILIVIAVGVIVLTWITVVSMGLTGQVSKKETIKIGIITDLTGPAAYWGESSRVGAEIAAEEMRKEGYDVELIYEDYQLDATKALSSAQKLVNIDNVDAIYAEFNPAAISVGSFLKEKNVLFVYDAAVISSLEGNDLAFKTYLDYKEGCKQVAEEFKEEGVNKLGVLKVNLEVGDLCVEGVKEVFPKAEVESYNLGEQDFKTPLLKLTTKGIEAVTTVFFEGDTLNTLKVLREQDLNIRLGTVDDSITEKVRQMYTQELQGTLSFGFRDVSPEFKEKIKDKKLATEYGAAITYTHIKQMVSSLDKAKGDKKKLISKMENSLADDTIGFKGFTNHIAELEMKIKKY